MKSAAFESSKTAGLAIQWSCEKFPTLDDARRRSGNCCSRHASREDGEARGGVSSHHHADHLHHRAGDGERAGRHRQTVPPLALGAVLLVTVLVYLANRAGRVHSCQLALAGGHHHRPDARSGPQAGIHDIGIINYGLILIVASYLLDRRGILLVTAGLIASAGVLVFGEFLRLAAGSKCAGKVCAGNRRFFHCVALRQPGRGGDFAALNQPASTAGRPARPNCAGARSSTACPIRSFC